MIRRRLPLERPVLWPLKRLQSAQTSLERLRDGRLRMTIAHDVVRGCTPAMIAPKPGSGHAIEPHCRLGSKPPTNDDFVAMGGVSLVAVPCGSSPAAGSQPNVSRTARLSFPGGPISV